MLKEDVLAYLNQKAGKQTATVQVNSIQDRREPIKGVRKIMAERMADSVATIPHFTFIDEFDITELMALRSDLVKTHGSEDLKITLMPLFIKALSLALNQFPIINSRANSEFTNSPIWPVIILAWQWMAKPACWYPILKMSSSLGLLDVAREVNRLTEAARSGVINPADLAGGSITISNIGVIGGTAAMPIINKPEVAIVALGKIQKLPRFDASNNVVSRNILTVSWSGDHRIIDGGTIARFNKLWKQYLEQPQTMLLAMLEL